MEDRNRQLLISERSKIIADLEKAEKQLFFGSFYPGSHEFTEEGFRAAQANAQDKKFLRQNLERVNIKLGLPPDSRQDIAE